MLFVFLPHLEQPLAFLLIAVNQCFQKLSDHYVYSSHYVLPEQVR